MRNTPNMLITAFVFAICGATSALAAQKVYKWTDENGQVHFSSSAPAGKAAETVRLQKGVDAPPTAPTDTAQAQTDPNAKPGDKPKMTDEQRAELSKYCTSMRERIDKLKQGGRLIEKNPDGSQSPLDNAGIDERLRTDEANVRNYCTANGL